MHDLDCQCDSSRQLHCNQNAALCGPYCIDLFSSVSSIHSHMNYISTFIGKWHGLNITTGNPNSESSMSQIRFQVKFRSRHKQDLPYLSSVTFYTFRQLPEIALLRRHTTDMYIYFKIKHSFIHLLHVEQTNEDIQINDYLLCSKIANPNKQVSRTSAQALEAPMNSRAISYFLHYYFIT